MANKITKTFGGNDGGTFELEFPKKLGLRTGSEVDALLLNGGKHGGSGGSNPTEIELGKTHYWSEFQVRSGLRIDYLRFKASNDEEIKGGGSGGADGGTFTGIRILRIGGKSGSMLDSIRIEYIQDYKPSTFIANAKGIFQIATSNQKIDTYSKDTTNIVLSYSHSTTVFSQSVASENASVSGEYYAEFSASTGYTQTDSTTTSITKQCTDAIDKEVSTSTKKTISDNEAGFLIGDIKIMQGSDGSYWMHPAGPATWITLKETEYKRLIGYYDFTSAADAQTGLTIESKYQFDYLTA